MQYISFSSVGKVTIYIFASVPLGVGSEDLVRNITIIACHCFLNLITLFIHARRKHLTSVSDKTTDPVMKCPDRSLPYLLYVLRAVRERPETNLFSFPVLSYISILFLKTNYAPTGFFSLAGVCYCM